MKKNILITGGTGLIGTKLAQALVSNGHNCRLLVRMPSVKTQDSFICDLPNNYIDPQALNFAQVVIHLAGVNIASGRWSDKRKADIVSSRVKTAELIFDKMKQAGKMPEKFISASAVGFYGMITSDKVYSETDPPGDDFLAFTCRQWEDVALRFEKEGSKTVVFRTGVVLSPSGGALQKMVKPVKYGIASPLGSGRQYLPWIHIDDLVQLYVKAVEDDSFAGIYNAVAPESVNNRDFTRFIAGITKRPCCMPNVPAFVLKMAFGEMSGVILYGSRVSAQKLLDSGFIFAFPTAENALRDILSK